jgi:hypothetical protein
MRAGECANWLLAAGTMEDAMAQTCSQCQTEAPDDANHCANCGAPLGAAPTAPAAPAAPAMGAAGAASAAAPAAGAAARSSVPPYRFDAARWSTADRIAGVATIVYFICLFLPWFTISGSFGGYSYGASVNGLWHGWMWITLIISILVVAYLVLRAGWDRLPVSQDVPHLTVMLVATIVTAVLTLIAFIDKPGGSGVGWGFGAVVGLIAAFVAAAPYAVPQLRAKTM